MDEVSEKEQKSLSTKGINYYVVAAIFISVLLFTFANSIEPQIDSQLDFFELIFVLAYAAPAVFSFIVARKLWGSRVFGRAYLSLTIAFASGAIGAALFDYYQMAGVENPYPGIPDIFFFFFYIFAIIHLRLNTRFGLGGKLARHQKMILIIIPLGVTIIYAFGTLFYSVISVTDSVPDLLSKQVVIGDKTFIVTSMDSSKDQHQIIVDNSTKIIPINLTGSTMYPQIYDNNIKFNLAPIFLKNAKFDSFPEQDQTFWNGFFTGLYFVAATSAVFAWTLVGAQVFRRSSQLGIPWALLLVGIGLNAVGDVAYYFTSIYSYDRTNPIIGIWVIGYMIVCYALYLHKKIA